MKYLYLVWSNLKRKKLRTILTLLSIMVAFMLFGYLGAIKQAFDPRGLMNPGKIVAATPMDDRRLFRYPPGYRRLPVTTGFDWSAQDPCIAVTRFARGVGLAMGGKPDLAEEELRALRELHHWHR